MMKGLAAMSVALVVRSYDKDFCWLDWSVRCMEKYLTGIDEKILITPRGQRPALETLDYFDKHVFSDEDQRCHGYIAQQIDKLTAWQHTQCEYLYFNDSDCMYKEPFDARSKLIDGRCHLYREKWDTVAEWGHFWRDVIRRYIGIESEYEYMRCQPIVHPVHVIRALLDSHPNLFDEARKLPIGNGEFSEFNLVGAFAAEHMPDRYIFSEGPFDSPVKAYWSHGGFTEEIASEIALLL